VTGPSFFYRTARALAALGVLLLLAALSACTAPRPAAPGAAGRIAVAVSVPPQGYLVERIGGPRVRVEVMIPPGASEATYSPNPRQMVALSRARLYVKVGHPAFLFEPQSIDPFLAAHKEIQVVDMSRGMDLLLTGGEGEGEAASHGFFGGGGEEEHDPAERAAGDPHVWVAPGTMRVAARNVEQALSALDPVHADFYRANLVRFDADLDALDREIRALLATAPGRSFMVYHPSWGYFAREYGLTQIAVEAGGREPSARQLIALIELARQKGVKAIFVQRGFARKSAQVIAGEIGGRVVEVDPMASDWLSGLRDAARAFRGGLSRG